MMSGSRNRGHIHVPKQGEPPDEVRRPGAVGLILGAPLLLLLIIILLLLLLLLLLL